MLTLEHNPCTHDTNWIDRKFNACIIDYRRFFKFTTDLTEAELNNIRDYLEEWNCPGWTGVMLRKVNANDLKDGWIPREYQDYYVAFTTNDMSG